MVRYFLQSLCFPITKREIMEIILDSNAPADLFLAIEGLPNNMFFDSVAEIEIFLGNIISEQNSELGELRSSLLLNKNAFTQLKPLVV